MQKKAQSAIEYLMIIGMTFAIIIPTVYLFFNYSRESTIEISDAQISRIGKSIVTSAEAIYYSGEHSKTVLEFSMPENINDIKIISNRELVFDFITQFGNSDIVFFSDVNITSAPGSCSGNECDLSSISSQGLQKLRIESISSGTQVLLQREP